MNEFIRQFIMTGIKDMIARNIALYQTYQYASGWFSKGVLLQEDLEEIERLYEEKTKEVEAEIEEIPVEEIIQEVIEDPIEETPVEESIEEVVEEATESEEA